MYIIVVHYINLKCIHTHMCIYIHTNTHYIYIYIYIYTHTYTIVRCSSLTHMDEINIALVVVAR